LAHTQIPRSAHHDGSKFFYPDSISQAVVNTLFWKGRRLMLGWSILFLIVAIVAGLLGFGGVAGAASSIAQILFVLFIILFVVSLIFGRRRVV
jgi:uncharacterized membrane protein YtjA (UPF0391 family)